MDTRHMNRKNFLAAVAGLVTFPLSGKKLTNSNRNVSKIEYNLQKAISNFEKPNITITDYVPGKPLKYEKVSRGR